MTDARLRTLEKRAAAGDPEAAVAALRARLRAGLVVPGYTSAREVACGFKACGTPTPRGRKFQCGTRGCRHGYLPFDPMDLVRLRAYLGDVAARGVVGVYGLCGCHESAGWCAHLEDVDDETPLLACWLTGLQRLAAKLPPARVDVECGWCDGSGERWSVGRVNGPYRCTPCNGTGKVTHDTPADRYLLVVAAEAVGRAVVGWKHDVSQPIGWRGHAALRALDACAAWIADPKPENGRACHAADAATAPPWSFLLVACYTSHKQEAFSYACKAIQAFAKILGDDRVRELVASAVLEVLDA